MLFRAESLTKRLKLYDRCLYAVEHKLNRVDIYRKSSLDCNPPHFLFSLTDTWQPTGRPIEYGIDVILNRVKALDLWRDDNFVENWIKDHEEKELSIERDRRNNIESFLYDFRGQFKKAFDSTNTGTLNKVYRKDDNTYGHCK